MSDARGDLDLAPIGNSSVSALLDRQGRYVWACLPRFDGDPAFCALLSGEPAAEVRHGVWSVELIDCVKTEQTYLRNTPILSTTLTLSISVNIAFFASIAFLATLLLGRAWGPAFAIAVYGLVMVGQSSSAGPDLIPLAGAGTEPYALHAAGVALAVVLLAGAAASWGRTRAIPRRGEG